ncbi:MAG: ATP-binding protein [Spirochaetaceae bacterium]|nr:ATP-binding protein [Spirochaetaceae bacterium]
MQRTSQKIFKKVAKLTPEPLRGVVDSVNQDNLLLEAILNAEPKAIVATGKKHELIFANTLARQLLQLPKRTNKAVWQLVINPFSEVIRMMLINDGTGTSEDFSHLNQLYNLECYPLAISGRLNGNVVLINNVTEQRKQQNYLRRQESLASISKMAQLVAHEIKNPLGALSIHLQLFNKKIAGESCCREQFGNTIEIFNEEINRLNYIATNYLDGSKPLQLTLSQSRLERVVTEALKLMDEKLKAENITVNCIVSNNLPLLLLDVNAVKQLLINLIVNAAQAMPAGGTLTLNINEEESYVVLSVMDSGSGIGRELQESIFTPYFTTKGEGSGLGLAMAYKIMQNHNGQIKLYSPPRGGGNGAEFVMFFPKTLTDKNLLPINIK